MSGAAQGASGGAAAADSQVREPTLEDDGFTPEEREQWNAMQAAENAPPAGEEQTDGAGQGSADQGADTGDQNAAGGGKAGAGKQIAAEDADDEEDDAAGDGQAQQGKDQNGQQQQRQPRRVNYNKFQRMEERAVAAEKERDSIKEMFSRTDERLKLLNEALSGANQRRQQENENEDPEPDQEKDVFGWTKWASRQMANMSKLLQGQQQEKQVSAEERTVADTYIGDVQRFVKSDEGKNFGAAYEWLMNQRTAQLAFYHYSIDMVSDDGKLDPSKLTVEQERRIKADIAAEERDLVTTAIKAQRSPAAAVYRMARAAGFRPAPPQAGAGAANGAGAGQGQGAGNNGTQQGSQGQQQGGNQGQNGRQGINGGGQANQGNGQGQGTPSVAAELERVRAGQAANKSLSSGAGSPGQQALTPERLANMSPEEFNALIDEIGDAGFQRLMENGRL